DWRTVTAPGTIMTGRAANVSYTSSGSPAMDTWLYTEGLSLTGGVAYRLQYKYYNNSTTWAERMAVAWGSAPNKASMTSPLADHPAISTTTVQNSVVDFTPDVDGVYYIGFQCYSIANQNQLYLDDVSVTLAPTCFPPTAITISNTTHASAMLSWTDNAAPAYNYEVRTSGQPGEPTGLVLSGSAATGSSPILLAPLDSAVAYTVYVQ